MTSYIVGKPKFEILEGEEEEIRVTSGGCLVDMEVCRGAYVVVDSGGHASRITVGSSGSLFVISGGSVDNATVNCGGTMYVRSGGLASSCVIEEYGTCFVNFGGDVRNLTSKFNAKVWCEPGVVFDGKKGTRR